MPRVIYTADVLNNGDILKQYVPEGWKAFCHHRTIKYGKQEIPTNLGATTELHAIAIYKDKHAVAAKLSDGGHVTIACFDVLPVYSNELVADSSKKVKDIDIHLSSTIRALVTNDDGTSAYWI